MNYNPWTAGLVKQQVMPGTVDPSQQQQGQFQQQLVDALRNFGGGAPQQQGQRITSANAGGEGMDTDALGQALGKGAGYLGSNFSTAMQYGTNPFSDQTSMLMAQNAGF